ncbi:hypothetical protein [Cupriavidus sp. YAF13]|uniref:hypothetical protein n=1 Tax=Cupriavidus sp. YAF13 TaxID=3233075 RepID=UPI003F92673C
MPHLQLDVNGSYALADKQRLANARSQTYTYAWMMSVDIRRISLVARDPGEGTVWRTIEGGDA